MAVTRRRLKKRHTWRKLKASSFYLWLLDLRHTPQPVSMMATAPDLSKCAFQCSWRPQALDLTEVELCVVVGYLMCVLGIES